MAGVETVEFLVVEQHSRCESGLLPEDHRLVVATQRDIDVRVGNNSLTQATIRPLIIRPRRLRVDLFAHKLNCLDAIKHKR
jgi:hypothetical protein